MEQLLEERLFWREWRSDAAQRRARGAGRAINVGVCSFASCSSSVCANGPLEQVQTGAPAEQMRAVSSEKVSLAESPTFRKYLLGASVSLPWYEPGDRFEETLASVFGIAEASSIIYAGGLTFGFFMKGHKKRTATALLKQRGKKGVEISDLYGSANEREAKRAEAKAQVAARVAAGKVPPQNGSGTARRVPVGATVGLVAESRLASVDLPAQETYDVEYAARVAAADGEMQYKADAEQAARPPERAATATATPGLHADGVLQFGCLECRQFKQESCEGEKWPCAFCVSRGYTCTAAKGPSKGPRGVGGSYVQVAKAAVAVVEAKDVEKEKERKLQMAAKAGGGRSSCARGICKRGGSESGGRGGGGGGAAE